MAATGRITLDSGTAVFDRISTDPAHRLHGLASAVVLSLDRLATQAASTDRLLVATEMGTALYTHLGWRTLAPFSTAVLPNQGQSRIIEQLPKFPPLFNEGQSRIIEQLFH